MPTRRQRIRQTLRRIGHLLRALARARRRLHELRHPPKPPAEPFVQMFDSVTVAAIPKAAEAVAGYVGGQWPTYQELVQRFPRAKHLSIAVSADESADCLDVEPGDATILQAPGWLKSSKAKAANTHKPVLYTSLGQAQALVAACAAAGIPRSGYYLWTAHWTRVPHLCGPECGLGFTGHADLTQYANPEPGGPNVDVSHVRARIFR